MFEDRRAAGQRLAKELDHYRDRSPLVLAIPRGGVEVGDQVARGLDAEFSILVSRKLPMPSNPEAGFGAIAEDGTVYLTPGAESTVPESVIERTVARQKEVIRSRIRTLRSGSTLPEMEGRTVILIDDGIAMGSTMQAAVRCCRNRRAGFVVVGAPVGAPYVEDEFRGQADDVVVVLKPVDFQAVAQGYRHWHDVSDEEVLAILKDRP